MSKLSAELKELKRDVECLLLHSAEQLPYLNDIEKRCHIVGQMRAFEVVLWMIGDEKTVNHD